MRETHLRDGQSVELGIAQVDSFQLRPGAVDDHRPPAEYSQCGADVVGHATVHGCPCCWHLGFRSEGRPWCMPADERGEKGVGMPAVARVEFG
jgi:hypothetical protein